MDPTSLLLEYRGGQKLGHEESLAEAEARTRNIPVRFVSLKSLLQKKWESVPDELPVGNIPFIHAVLKSLGKEIPPVDYYPEALKPWLFRQVWKMPYKRLFAAYDEGQKSIPVFVKPAERVKAFTGQVVSCWQDLSQIACSKQLLLACSDPVEWLAEWRVYVVKGEIRAVNSYPGPSQHQPNLEEIKRAVAALLDTGRKQQSFAIDFGLLSTGETALVEVGDGYSIGAYSIGSKDYFEFLAAAWEEL